MRRWTPLRRYACRTCGHRGWTLHRLRDGNEWPPGPDPLPSRPLEARDRRQRSTRRRATFRVALVATALGAGTAYLILILTAGG